MLSPAAATVISSTVELFRAAASRTQHLICFIRATKCIWERSHSSLLLYLSFPISPLCSTFLHVSSHHHVLVTKHVFSRYKSKNKHWTAHAHTRHALLASLASISNSQSLHDLLVQWVMNRSPPALQKNTPVRICLILASGPALCAFGAWSNPRKGSGPRPGQIRPPPSIYPSMNTHLWVWPL